MHLEDKEDLHVVEGKAGDIEEVGEAGEVGEAVEPV